MAKDYHIHPGYSADAEASTIDQYCRRALALGLTEICFTTHFECDPVRREIDWYVRLHGSFHPMDQLSWVESYLQDIERARENYQADGLTVRAGVEVGYDYGLEEPIRRLVENYPFDFVLGSIHCLDHLAISSSQESLAYFPGKKLQQVCCRYFEKLIEGVKTGLFDCMAHLDLYRRHGEKYFGPAIAEAHRDFIEPLMTELVKTGTGLEINTSSRRRGLQEFHPSRPILQLAKDYGLSIFTVGSDAHDLTQLGDGVLEAEQILSDMGLTAVSFSGRKIVTG